MPDHLEQELCVAGFEGLIIEPETRLRAVSLLLLDELRELLRIALLPEQIELVCDVEIDTRERSRRVQRMR